MIMDRSVHSSRRIEASRRNGRKSRGPRTAAGKAIVSRNALRHGFAAGKHRASVPSDEIEQLARAFCADDKNPLLFAPAVEMAAAALTLRSIEVECLRVVERLRDRREVAFAKGDQRLQQARALVAQADGDWQHLKTFAAALLEKYKSEFPPDLDLLMELDAALPLQDFLAEREQVMRAAGIPPEPVADDDKPADAARDEVAMMAEALSDLLRLKRYHRRALGRQNRAFRAFIAVKSSSLSTAAV
jgi:hypothetical protein